MGEEKWAGSSEMGGAVRCGRKSGWLEWDARGRQAG